MKIKKVISTVLCAAMVGALLTGCGGKGDTTTPAENTSNASSEESGSESESGEKHRLRQET